MRVDGGMKTREEEETSERREGRQENVIGGIHMIRRHYTCAFNVITTPMILYTQYVN